MEGASHFEQAVVDIYSSIIKEKEDGFNRLCFFELDEYGLDANEIKFLIDSLSAKYEVEYYGDERYAPEGCRLYHDHQDVFVGKLLIIDWE
jgi:hypothetical protein